MCTVMLHHRALLLVLAVGFTTLGCSGSTVDPQRQVEVVSPATGLKVSAVIASVTLGDSSSSASNLQIAFVATEATSAATAEIASVVLVDSSTGAIADTLRASQPQVWNGSGYEQWNQRVTPGGDLKASYQLTSPDWSTIDGSGLTGGGRSSSRSYKTPFKLRVTMKIDGVEVVLESNELHREPAVAT